MNPRLLASVTIFFAGLAFGSIGTFMAVNRDNSVGPEISTRQEERRITEAERSLVPECEQAYDESELAACVNQEIEQKERVLHEIVEELRARYLMWEDIEPGYEASFVRSHEIWKEYAETTCEYDHYESRTGTGYGTILAFCRYTMLEERIAQLSAKLESP